jgi:hypothetical protein
MRNALYTGPATIFVRELAGSPAFHLATSNTFKNERYLRDMKDREAVNRFLAHYCLGWHEYGTDKYPDYDEFLGSGLRYLNKNESKIRACKIAFLKSMALNYDIFEEHAFRKPAKGGRRNSLNIALFEVLSVCMCKYVDSDITEFQKKRIRIGFGQLLKQKPFSSAVTYGTLEAKNVHRRFLMTEQLLSSVLD